MFAVAELTLVVVQAGSKVLQSASVSYLCAGTAVGLESVSGLAYVNVQMAPTVPRAAGSR